MVWTNISHSVTLQQLRSFLIMQKLYWLQRVKPKLVQDISVIYGDWSPISFCLTVYLQHLVLQQLVQVTSSLAHIVTNPLGLLSMWVSQSSVIVILSFYNLHLQFINDLNPPTKLLHKFSVAWVAHKEKQSKEILKGGEKLNDNTTESAQDTATVALALSTCLVARRKNNALNHMTSGVEMLALAITMCTEVCIFHSFGLF